MSVLLKNAILLNQDKTDIFIEGALIQKISPSQNHADIIIDLKERTVLPGIIDPHAHLRDMKLAAKEDWESGSMAAAAGGITTTFDMPNTNPATFDLQSLSEKRKAAAKSLVNYSYNFGVNRNNLTEINAKLPIAALKMFMAESSSGRVIDDIGMIKDVFRISGEIGKPVIVHSELQSCVEHYSDLFAPTIENHNNIRNRACGSIIPGKTVRSFRSIMMSA